MKNVIRNHSAQQNALSTLQSAQTAEGNALQAQAQADYTKDSIALQKAGYSLSRKWSNISLGVNMAKVGIDIGTSVVSMITTADQSSATNELNEMTAEGERLVDESVASGETYFGTNAETGEIELVMSPKVTEWYDNARKSIEDSNHLYSTKRALLQSLDYTYENLQTSANKSTVQKYYSNLNTNFQTSLSSAKRTDTESYVAAGGNIDLWNQSATIEGISVIYGRNDWSAQTKATQTTDYLQSVVSEGDTIIASNYARSSGLQAAYDYIAGLAGYTEEEKQKMYSTASNAVVQATAAATETAEGYMADALINGNGTPEEVYSLIATQYEGMSPAIINAANAAAKAKQTEVATTAYNNQLTSDKADGLFALYTTYTAMETGAWDDLFYGITDTKNSALGAYKSAITSAEEKYGKSIDESNKTLFADYEAMQKTNLTLFNQGQITGTQYIENEVAYANAFYAGVKEGGASSTSTWNAKVDGLATEAINKVINNAIPEIYQSATSNAFATVKIKMGYNLTTSKMTAEAQEQVYAMNLEFNGKVAAYINSYIKDNGSFSVEEFTKYVNQAALDYVSLRQSKGYTSLMEGKYMDEKYMNKKVNDFNDALDLAYGYDTGNYFVKLGTDIATGNARYTFANETVEQTFQELSTVAKTEISWLTGYDVKDMSTVCVLDDDGFPILAPQVNVNGESYRFKDGTIQICTDGKTWTETGIKLASTEDKMKSYRAKSTAYQTTATDARTESFSTPTGTVPKMNVTAPQETIKEPMPADSETPKTETQKETTSAETPTATEATAEVQNASEWVKANPNASSASIKAYLEQCKKAGTLSEAAQALRDAADIGALAVDGRKGSARMAISALEYEVQNGK